MVLAIIVLLVLWGLGLSVHVGGHWIHLFALSAAVVTAFKLVRLVQGRAKKLPKESPPLLLTEFEVPLGWDLPKDFATKDRPGLLLCQVIEANETDPAKTQTRLLAWWDNAGSYTYWAKRFLTLLGLPDPAFKGVMVGARSSEENFWKKLWKNPLLPITILTTVVAGLTSINQFATFVTWASARPDAALVHASPITIVLDEPHPMSVTVGNRTHGDCEVVLNQPVILKMPEGTPASGLEIPDGATRRLKLTEGGTTAITYTLVGREVGKFRLQFSGTQHSGVMRGDPPLQGLGYDVEVWSKVDLQPSVSFEFATPNGNAQFAISARHGHPPGRPIQYQAVLNKADVSFVDVSPGTVSHISQNHGVAVLTWEAMAEGSPTAPGSPAPQRFEVTVNGKNLNENDWKSLAKAKDLYVVAQYPVTQ